MKSFFMALSFLTIMPWWSGTRGTEKDMSHTLYYYPVVGLLLGGVLAGVYFWADFLALGTAGAALIVVLWLILTGGLHADGLMDASDSFFSGKDRESKLEIMRDSRVGAMGVMALAAMLILKVSFLDILAAREAVAILILAPALGRLAMVWAVTRYRYARSEPGLGDCFGANRPMLPFYTGVFILIIVVVFLYILTGVLHVFSVLIVLLIALGVAAMIARNLEGHTGDTYGFLGETTETLLLIAVAIETGISGTLL